MYLLHHHPRSYNRLKLPGVAERVLDDRAARTHHVSLRGVRLGFLLREVDAAVLCHPAARLRKLDDGALGVEEEQVLCVGNGEGRVGALGARGDFGADGVDEDLFSNPLALNTHVTMNIRIARLITHLREDSKLLARHSLALHLAPHLIITALHKRLLQPNRIPHKLILLHRLLALLAALQPLKQRMETRVIALAKQQQQVQPRDFALVALLP